MFHVELRYRLRRCIEINPRSGYHHFTLHTPNSTLLKIYPQPLLIVETKPVEKTSEKISSTGPVEKFQKSHIALWRKTPCVSKIKPTFPHKFPLLIQRLSKPMIDKYLYLYFTRKEPDYAFYL